MRMNSRYSVRSAVHLHRIKKVFAFLGAMVTATGLAVTGLAVTVLAQPLYAQDTVEWLTLGSDYAHTRSTTASQIHRDNVESLQVAWTWDGASFKALSGRSTPSYVNGRLYTVAGERRHVIAIDPASGETLWSWREPHTFRHEYSMRKDYGKGVAYAEVDGRGVIYIVSPGFFLTALDADTGAPLPGFGEKVPLPGFPETGVVDLQKRIAEYMGYEFDPYYGIPLEEGYISNSSPPIVVNGVVIVGNSAEQGYNQTRIENIPGDVLAFDARTGDFLWKFNVIPEPGEFGSDTWQVDGNPRDLTGEVTPWAPLSADPEAGLVYFVTNPPSIDYFAGFTPGDNLFGTSIVALDVKTGERKWHFQFVHHDIWNYDTPTAPVLLDVQHNGVRTPAVVQMTKHGFAFAFNRITGEPLWPIEERAVPQSLVPGEHTAATQPFPTRPAAFEVQGITHDDLIDFTPQLRQQAIDNLANFQLGPLFLPPLHRDNPLGKAAALQCPSDAGGANIFAPPVADPVTGVFYVTSRSACSAHVLAPSQERDTTLELPTGTTFAAFSNLRNLPVRGPEGLPLFKPPFSRITAIDMNTGEHLWQMPVGETPRQVREHPALQGIELGNTGSGDFAIMMTLPDMLVYAAVGSDDKPYLFAVDKLSGETLTKVEVPSPSRYGMMSYVHQGRQYIILQTGSTLTAMALPEGR